MIGLDSGIPLGHIAGIQIRIHWMMLVFWVFRLQGALDSQWVDRQVALAAWALGVLIVFGSILLHELGHCFAARRVGGYADMILMWPLGGLAFCQCPDDWKSHFIVAAGGPLVTVAIVALSYLGFFLFPLDLETASAGQAYFYDLFRFYLVEWNFIILIFNLIPLYPMDGGRIFHSLLWGFYNRRYGHNLGGYGRATKIALVVGRVTAAGGIFYGLHQESMMLVILFAWAWMSLEQSLGRRWVL